MFRHHLDQFLEGFLGWGTQRYQVLQHFVRLSANCVFNNMAHCLLASVAPLAAK